MNPFAISYFDRDMGCDTVFYNIMKREEKSQGLRLLLNKCKNSYVNVVLEPKCSLFLFNLNIN